MIPLFSTKKNIRRTGLLSGMTDVHTHLLPGVDDGSETLERTLEILNEMSELGIRRVFLTPHVTDEQPDNTPGTLTARFNRLKEAAIPTGMELCLAAEYMLSSGIKELFADGLLTFPGRQVLVETSYLAPPFDLSGLLYDLSIEGYTPVIAHPERYLYMTDADYAGLKNKGYKFQLNLFSLCGVYGSRVLEKARLLLNQGFYDYTGSDCHHIEGYCRGMDRLSLSRSQVGELELLMENNNAL